MQLPGWTRGLCLAAAVVLSACGDVKSNPDGNPASFTLSVDPTTLMIPIAGSSTVTVTIDRGGVADDIMLSAMGLGANLTAEFSPNPLPAGVTTSQATISVVGGTAPATSTVTLTGTAGARTHSAMVSVTTHTINVTGTVRGNRAGVQVGIVGKQSVTSGAGGVFMFTDVTPPYDLYTVASSGCGTSVVPTAYHFTGLTRPDPTVTAATAAPSCVFLIICGIISPCPQSNISGTKSGSGNNTDPVVFAWSNGSFTNGVLNSNATYSGTAVWRGSNTDTGNLYALQMTRKANGAPNTFLGFAKSGQTTLTDGSPTTINLAFSTVNSTATVTGTLAGPAGYPSPSINLFQEFGNTQISLWSTTTTAIDATFPLIAMAGGNSLHASSSLAGVGTSQFVQPLTGATTVSFTMPTAAVLATPADASTGVTTTTMFAWTAPAGVISELDADATSTQGTAKASFRIFTMGNQARIPVIPELPLPSGQSYTWRVVGYGPNAHVNEAAAANELESVVSNDYAGPAHASTFSISRSFTTQ